MAAAGCGCSSWPRQLHSGTRALHGFGYRFPGFLLAGGDHGDLVENLRLAVFESPGVTSPAQRGAAGASADEIYEVTVAAAVGAALRTFDAGRHAIHHEASG